jgi:hypothetical protein
MPHLFLKTGWGQAEFWAAKPDFAAFQESRMPGKMFFTAIGVFPRIPSCARVRMKECGSRSAARTRKTGAHHMRYQGALSKLSRIIYAIKRRCTALFPAIRSSSE